MVTGLPPATIEQWKRTSAPVCSVDRTRGKWRLYLNFSSRKGDKAKRKTGPAFDSRQSALEGMLAFRISWEYSHRGQPWVATEDHVVPRLGSGAVDTTLPAGKSFNSLGNLSAAQERQFKRQRMDGSRKTRAEFAKGAISLAVKRRSM